MKNLVSILAVATALSAVGMTPAKAVIFQYGYSAAQGESGPDSFGNTWAWNTTYPDPAPPAEPYPGPGGGYSAWGTPGLGDGSATYGGTKSSNLFEVSFQTPSTSTTIIDTTPSPYSPDQYVQLTRLVVDGVQWTPEYLSANSVEFVAPVGDFATTGSLFHGAVVFTGSDLSGTNSGFTATWGLSSAVPETSTWLMMLSSFGALGFVGHRRQKAVQA